MYEQFVNLFSAIYEVVQDNSVEREIDSDDSEYVLRSIRERYITGSSCTIVLCGRNTPWRKFVDWEIKATLDKEHALVGVILPSCRVRDINDFVLPPRLEDNCRSQYAFTVHWAALVTGSVRLGMAVDQARAASKRLIVNNRQLAARNGTPPPW